jgi:hypothetical protein
MKYNKLKQIAYVPLFFITFSCLSITDDLRLTLINKTGKSIFVQATSKRGSGGKKECEGRAWARNMQKNEKITFHFPMGLKNCCFDKILVDNQQIKKFFWATGRPERFKELCLYQHWKIEIHQDKKGNFYLEFVSV